MEAVAQEILTFAPADYAVWGCIISFSLAIGVFYACTGGRQRTTEEFLAGDRNMHPLPVALSISVSFVSAVTFLGTTSESYINGVKIWLHCLAVTIGASTTAVFFLPVFYRLKVTSANEYLELRFNKATRRLGTVVLVLNMFIYMGVVLYGPALALNQVAGLNLTGSILTIGLACTFYTTIGGLKAVIWTDVFQALIMLVGLVAVIIRGSIEVGGFSNVIKIVDQGERLDLFDMRIDVTIRHTFWSIAIGTGFLFISLYGVTQGQVQRYVSCRSERDAIIALMIGCVNTVILTSLAVTAGMVMYAYYAECDPLAAGLVAKGDQMIPYFTLELFQDTPGLPGLFLSAIFSASLSSISSGLNSVAAVTTEDIIKVAWPGLSDLRYTQLSKLVAVIYGLLVIGFAFLASELGNILQTALNTLAMVGGPTLGLFSAGMILPWVNSKGAFFGTIVGLAFSGWLVIGSQFNPVPYPRPPVSTLGCDVMLVNSTTMMANFTPIATTEYTTILSETTEGALVDDQSNGGSDVFGLYKLSYSWYPAVAWLVTVVATLLISVVTGPTDPKKLDPRLICPMVDKMYCCLPEKWKIPLRCGVGEEFEGNAAHLTENQTGEVHPDDLAMVGDFTKHGEVVDGDHRGPKETKCSRNDIA